MTSHGRQDPQAQIVVHGIYSVSSRDEQLKNELLHYCSYLDITLRPDAIAFVATVIPLVLVDVSATGLDETFDAGAFTQRVPSALAKISQVAYDEALLSWDGGMIVAREQGCAKGLRECRLGFYFHYYNPALPMQWTYGEFPCPLVQPAGERLLSLIPYRDK